MIDRARLEAYLANVDLRFDGVAGHAVLMQFMCRCLELAKPLLPEPCRNALEVAARYWTEARGTAAELEAARIECWRYLDSKGRGGMIVDRDDAAMRAVICVLFAEPDSDDFSAETVRWFVAMLDRLGDFSTQAEHLMEI